MNGHQRRFERCVEEKNLVSLPRIDSSFGGMSSMHGEDVKLMYDLRLSS
jgi:hypothetical protein